MFNNLALLYKDLGRYESARLLYRKVVAFWENEPNADRAEFATVLSNEAQLNVDYGRYATAEAELRRVLALRRAKFGEQSREVANCLNNLGSLYYRKGRPKEAEQFIRQAVAILEEPRGQDPTELAIVPDNLVVLRTKAGWPAEAETLLGRAIEIWSRSAPYNSKFALALNSLGKLKVAGKKYDEADRLFGRAVAISENALGPDHSQVGGILIDRALLLRKMHRKAEAIQAETRAHRILGGVRKDLQLWTVDVHDLGAWTTERRSGMRSTKRRRRGHRDKTSSARNASPRATDVNSSPD